MSVALNFNGQSGVMQGDSRTYGWLSSAPDLAWAYLVCNEKDGLEVNLGAPGQFLQPVPDTNSFSTQYTPTKAVNNSKYMFFSFGTNDTKGDYTIYNADAFQSALENALDFFTENLDWLYQDIITPTINYFPLIETQAGLSDRVIAYNTVIQAVAQSRNTIYFDPYTHFYNLSNRDTYFNSDGIHENDAGHRELANFYELQDYTPINGFPIPPTTTTTTLSAGNIVVKGGRALLV